MYHKSVKTLYLNLLLPFCLTQFPLISSEKREHSATKERASASNKTRETKKQRGRVQSIVYMEELKKHSIRGSRDQKHNVLLGLCSWFTDSDLGHLEGLISAILSHLRKMFIKN
jgi:hypothetical protein